MVAHLMPCIYLKENPSHTRSIATCDSSVQNQDFNLFSSHLTHAISWLPSRKKYRSPSIGALHSCHARQSQNPYL